uniref:Ig-like domain-containing protein n=1 Tax=Monopterus albus TaxID=43700 RepID=A0A3Q3JDQ1_MONAL
MQRPTGFWLYTVLLSVVLSSALAEDIPVYFRVGGSLEMRPQPEQTAITSIVWEHNGDLVAEWDNESPLTYWGEFKGRTTLDTTTGRLEIRNMGEDDAGNFTVEINKVQNESYAAIVVKEVVLKCALGLDITEYFKVGGSLELRPQQQQTAITSIVWKHNGDLVAEWVDKESPLTYWTVFRDRTTLDTTTGRLEIRNMSKDDAGNFIVEINNQVQSKSYPAKVAKDVPKPTVLVTCNPAVEICLLSCDGDTTETGPVDYYWKFGDRGWKQREKDIITNKTEIQSAETFSCRMKNLVDEKESDPVKNPLFKEPNK